MFRARTKFGLSIRWSRLVTYTVLILLALVLVGCKNQALLDWIVEMATEWAVEKGLLDVAEDGTKGISWLTVGLYGTQKLTTGTTGDRLMDAAVEVGPIAHSVYQADKAAAEGMKNRDPAKLDEAIGRRPGDWNYHDQKASILAANGDEQGMDMAMSESDLLVKERIRQGEDCLALYKNQIRGRGLALEQQLKANPDNTLLQQQHEITVADLTILSDPENPANPCYGG